MINTITHRHILKTSHTSTYTSHPQEYKSCCSDYSLLQAGFWCEAVGPRLQAIPQWPTSGYSMPCGAPTKQSQPVELILGNGGVWLLKVVNKRYSDFCLSLSEHLLCGSQLPCYEDTQTAQQRVPHGEKPGSEWQESALTCQSQEWTTLELDSPTQVRSSDDSHLWVTLNQSLSTKLFLDSWPIEAAWHKNVYCLKLRF